MRRSGAGRAAGIRAGAAARVGLILVAALTVSGFPRSAAAQVTSGLAPVELWAEGFGDLRGIAVDPATGLVHVADRESGTVTRIAPGGVTSVVVTFLERPVGLAFDAVGRLLIAEERAGRVVRLEASGALTPLLSGVKQPRWLAVGEGGTVYVSARRLTRGTDPEPDDESVEPEAVLALSPAGQLSVFADGFR